MIDKWDIRFIEMAETISSYSKDPSKKIGAVAVNDRKMILSTGWNGFPRGISDTQFRLSDRGEKYKLVVHAEMNAIYNAGWNGVCLDGATMYVYGLPVCSECSKGIIQSGIKRVVMKSIDPGQSWIDSFETTKMLFEEAGIEYEFIE